MPVVIFNAHASSKAAQWMTTSNWASSCQQRCLTRAAPLDTCLHGLLRSTHASRVAMHTGAQAYVSATEAQSPGANAASADTLDLNQTIKLYYFAALQGVVVTAINVIVALLIETVSLAERHVTTTSYLAGFVTKLSIFYIANSFIVPILAVVTSGAEKDVWCASERDVKSLQFVWCGHTAL
jgi:hypothetical protein